MSFEKYLEKKNKIIKNLDEMRKKIDDSRVKNIIDSKRDILKEDKFTISVFGHYSAGKSSFLNALMGFGTDVLKEDELPTTATITRIKYLENKDFKDKVEIFFGNGDRKLVKLEELDSYTTTSADIDVENEIKEVVFYVESELLKNKVEIVDTPGFNSTNELHTEIAKEHISNSDASIYIFDYKQAGTKKDFEFLADINDKMDRVFLILNKVDLHDDTEGNIEETIESLRKKIEKHGAEIENKQIYPISAFKQKRILNGEEKSEFFSTLFNKFNEDLAGYLTSEENVKDRLLAPLKNIISEIMKIIDDKKNQLEIVDLDKNESEEKLQELEESLDELNEELKSRKKQIKRGIDLEVRKTCGQLEEEHEKLLKEIDDKMENDIKSIFSLSEDIAKETIEDLEKRIERKMASIQRIFLGSINEIISENIDEEDGCKDLEKSLEKKIGDILKKKAVYKSQNMNFIKEDNRELNKVKEELNSIEKNLRDKKEEIYKIRENNENIEKQEGKIKNKQKEIEKLEKDKKDALLSIKQGEVKYVESEEILISERQGLVGKLGNVLFGDKKEKIKKMVKDTSSVDRENKERTKVNEIYREQIEKNEKERNNLEKKIRGSKVSEERVEMQLKKIRKEEDDYYRKAEKLGERENEYKEEIFRKNKRKVKRIIVEYIDIVMDEFKITIKDSKSNIAKITEESLIDLIRKIDIKVETIEKIKENQIIENKDGIRKQLIEEKIQLNEGFEVIQKLKEEVI